MADALAQVLRLVADGRITAEQAAPILDALSDADLDGPPDDEQPADREEPEPESHPGERKAASAIRIEVTDQGHRVVNLRVPITLGRMALERIPGLSGANIEDLVRQALSDGRSGTLLHIDDDDDEVRISLE